MEGHGKIDFVRGETMDHDPEAMSTGEPPEDWAETLYSADPACRLVAFERLTRLGARAKGAIPTLCRILEDRAEPILWRMFAASVLGKFGEHARVAVAGLISALSEEEPLHSTAVSALGKLGPIAEVASWDLFKVFLDDTRKPFQRYCAAAALGLVLQESGSKARSFVPILLEKLTCQAENDSVRGGALSALGDLGPAAAESIPQLTNMLRDGNRKWRLESAIALVKIGREPSAREAAELLQAEIACPDRDLRSAALLALLGFSDENMRRIPDCSSILQRAMYPLLELANEASEGVSRVAIEILARMGPIAAPAIPTIRSLLHRSPHEVREAAEEALRRIELGSTES